MITVVQMYRTNDGKNHKSVAAAEEYVLNQAAEILAKRLPLKELGLTGSQQYKVIDALTKDMSTLKSLYSDLYRLMDED